MSDCIVPQHGHKDKDGYPRCKHQGRLWRLNRLIYTLSFGEIPEGKVVAHKCNDKGCVNPHHFYLTTHQQNSTDAARDRLYKQGADHYKTKRSDAECQEMWYLYHTEHLSQQAIGDIFGITQSRVSECIRRAQRILDR